jgi:hypothetical protein
MSFWFQRGVLAGKEARLFHWSDCLRGGCVYKAESPALVVVNLPMIQFPPQPGIKLSSFALLLLERLELLTFPLLGLHLTLLQLKSLG